MKICIDGIGVNHLYGSGLYCFTRQLLDNLICEYPQAMYFVVWDSSSKQSPWAGLRNVTQVEIPIYRKKDDFSSLANYLSDNQIDIFHSPNNGLSIPKGKSCKNVITVHDLSPVSLPEYSDRTYLERFQRLFPKSAERSDRIIAVSGFIKSELIRLYGIPENRISIVYPGCSSIFKPLGMKSSSRQLTEKFGISGGYMLYAGSIHPRKRLDVLLKLFSEVSKSVKGLKLVIAGKTDGKREDYFKSLEKYAKQLDILDSIVFTGIVEYEEMPVIYNGALCYISTSEYEGFPTAAIEASACGIPVICRRLPSHIEVLGQSAIYSDFTDTALIRDILISIAEDANSGNCRLRESPGHSSEFCWNLSIRKLVSIYETLVFGS